MGNAQLVKNASQMGVDRADGKEQRVSDFLVRMTVQKQLCHLALTSVKGVLDIETLE